MVYVAIAAIAVGVLMLGAVALQLRRGRTPPKRILDLPEEEQALLTDSSSRPPTFRVIALGLSGAGKTLLLSSMYHALNFPSNARPYHLETGAADATLLANIRDQVLDRDAGWPSATPLVDERDFRFDYVARDASGQKHTILRMEYLDYAGEILTPGDQEGIANLEKLEERIQGAHALLGLIDGIKLRKFKQGDPEGLRYFDAVLLPMIGFMQQASCPIQLVVTKWDLVPDLDRPGPVNEIKELKQVREALMSVPQIRALVEDRGSRKIRFIPVSAVGWHFARLAEGDDTPVKLPDGELAPVNVDIPLCAVIADLLQQAAESLDRPLRRRITSYVRRSLWQDAQSLVAVLLQSPVGAVLRGVDGVLVFLEWIVRQTPAPWWTRRSVGVDPEQERLRGELIAHMEARVQMLETMLPESVP